MPSSESDTTGCLFCGAELQSAPVLIMCQINGEDRKFVECPKCGEPVQPE